MSVCSNPRRVIKNHGALLDNIRKPELWLMWYVSFATWGAMTMANSNSAQIYKAIAGPGNFDDARNTVFVSLFGLGSALGRVTMGALKPVFEERDIPVWWLFPIAPLLMAVALASFFVLPAGGLFVPFFAVGYAGGVAWGATVMVIKRLFTEAGRHYSFLYTAGMLTPLFFNLWLFSSTYESNSESQHQAHLSDCNGLVCITMPVLVALAMNLAAFPVAVIFSRRVDEGHICD
jgi:MFS family permease